MEYCITINPIPHSQYRTKFDYEWSIEYQLIRNLLVSVNIRSASLLIFKILYYGMSIENENNSRLKMILIPRLRCLPALIDD